MNVYVLSYDYTFYDEGAVTMVGVFSTPEKAQAYADKQWGKYNTVRRYDTLRGGTKATPSVWEFIYDGVWLRQFYNSDTGDDVTLRIETGELDIPMERTP